MKKKAVVDLSGNLGRESFSQQCDTPRGVSHRQKAAIRGVSHRQAKSLLGCCFLGAFRLVF
ncbi:MAG: hypothetical protein K5918_06345 [Bacteroidales bacterium]|nr:hypothetical protein [Bacteroidales bacterium]